MYKKIVSFIKREGFLAFLLKAIDQIFKPLGISFLSFIKLKDYDLSKNPYISKKFNQQEIFTKIYKNQYWKTKDSVSGSGSDFNYIKTYLKNLDIFFNDYKIKSFFDVPCGNFLFMNSFLENKNIDYLGGDIVKQLISRNINKYPKYKFKYFDITKDTIKKSFDVLHVRDCLFHFSYEDIEKALNNIFKIKSKYILITNHKGLLMKNYNITTGKFRPLDFEKEPFSFPKPMEKIKDYKIGQFPRYVYVWETKELKKHFNKIKKNVVLISNGGGGIATFQQYFIKAAIKNHNVYLIDKENNHTSKYFNSKLKKKLNQLKCDPIWEPKKLFKHINYIKNENDNNEETIFLFSNPLLLIMTFLFIKLYFKNKKIYLFYHSHILKLNFSQIITNIISSIISPFISKVFFVSNFTKSWWLKYFFIYRFSNHEVFYNSIFLPKRRKTRKIVKRIGFVGRLEKEKGIDVYSNIAKKLLKYNFEFQIFGAGTYKNKIFKNKKIHLNGWLNQKSIYRKIDILLLTSPIENCPYSVLEAKSYGIPTLCISRGGVREIIKNNYNGIILKNKFDINQIKNSLFNIKKKYNKFERECIKDSKKFDEKINLPILLKKL